MSPSTILNGPATAGVVLALVRERRASMRSELVQQTGLSRATLGARLEALMQRGLLVEAGTGATGGRPAGRFRFNASAGSVLVADLGVTHVRLGVADLAGTLLAERAFDLPIADGPETVLSQVLEIHLELLRDLGLDITSVWGIGMGVPGPVDFASGRAVRPPIMPGWDGFDIPAWYAGRSVNAAVFVDNDVNVMTLGEYGQAPYKDAENIVFIKVASGIGSGLILHGEVYRGARGAAGDIGHLRVDGADDVVCRCGNTGCLEAVAGGAALARQLSHLGVAGVRDIVKLVAAGDPETLQATREAGRRIGEALAAVVNLLNPQLIIIGGDLAETHDYLLAGIREVVYRRSTALATDQLRITGSRLRERAGIVGCATLAIEELLTPQAIDRALAVHEQSA